MNNYTNIISGSGKKPYVPIEYPDTLKSTSYIEILDLIGEGEIEGLVTGDERSIYLNGTPVRNLDGSFNFTEVVYSFKNGTSDQTASTGFDDVKSEISVSTEVRYNLPITKYIGNSNADEKVADKVRITLSTPALMEYKDNGDTTGSTIKYKIILRKNGDTEVAVIEKELSGKNSSKYAFTNIIDLPRTTSEDYFDIVVHKLTPDSTSIKIQNSLLFDSYTLVSSTKLSYPYSALCGIRFNATQFSSVPSRGYFVKLLKVKIPSNYNPTTRTYSGAAWDGNFKSALTWTDNPAWCFYDLLTNPRYGLGEYIDPVYIDKWSLYTIARYCDELVPSGYGTGTEPRFTLNAYIQTREDAIKILSDLSSVFRGMIYWGNGSIVASQDSFTTTPSLQFNNSNVLNGIFTYSGASKKVIHTAALVSWNDQQAQYEQKVEYVEDRESIDRYGYNPTEIVAFGCTSRGQAHRLGKWLLYTERVESNIVSFSAGLDSAYTRPGDVIKVFDHAVVNVPYSGRVVSSRAYGGNIEVVLDRIITLPSPGTYTIRLNTIISYNTPAGVPSTKFATAEYLLNASTGTSNTVYISQSVFNEIIDAGTIWTISSNTLSEKLYRLISIKENDTNTGLYDLVGMLYNPDKFNFIENNIALPNREYSTLNRIPTAIDLESIQYSDSLYFDNTGSVKTYLSISFAPSLYAVRYNIEIRKDNSNWELVYSATNNTAYTIYNVTDKSIYEVKITPFNALNRSGPPTIVPDILIKGKTAPPADIPWAFINGSTVRWGEVSDIDLAGYRVKTILGPYNNNWGLATLETAELVQGDSFTVNNYNGDLTILIKAVDTSGNESINPAIFTTNMLGNTASNVIYSNNEKTEGFLGTRVNSIIDGDDNLTALEAPGNYMWEPNDLSVMYDLNSNVNIYGPYYLPMVYTTLPYPTTGYTSTSTTDKTIVYLDYSINTRATTIEYTLYGTKLAWNTTDDTVAAWDINNSGIPAWDQTLSNFVPYNNDGIDVSSDTMGDVVFRFTSYGGPYITSITKLIVVIDMPDITVHLEDQPISSLGTRFSNILSKFKNITAVSATLQAAANSAVAIKVIDKSSTLGPLIECYDSSGSNVSGVADITIRGY